MTDHGLDAGSAVGPEQFRAALSRLASGVTVITTPPGDAGAPAAMTATAFCSVSLDPPLVLVSVGRASRFHPALLAAASWAVSLLAADQAGLAAHFADSRRDLATQFDAVGWQPSPQLGAPLITGAQAWLECRTWHTYAAGDHTLVVGLVIGAGEGSTTSGPLTYHRGTFRADQGSA